MSDDGHGEIQICIAGIAICLIIIISIVSGAP